MGGRASGEAWADALGGRRRGRLGPLAHRRPQLAGAALPPPLAPVHSAAEGPSRIAASHTPDPEDRPAGPDLRRGVDCQSAISLPSVSVSTANQPMPGTSALPLFTDPPRPLDLRDGVVDRVDVDVDAQLLWGHLPALADGSGSAFLAGRVLTCGTPRSRALRARRASRTARRRTAWHAPCRRLGSRCG